MDRSLSNLMLTENKILKYDYNKLMYEFKIKEKLKLKSHEKVILSWYSSKNTRITMRDGEKRCRGWMKIKTRTMRKKGRKYRKKLRKNKIIPYRSRVVTWFRIHQRFNFSHNGILNTTDRSLTKANKLREHSEEAAYRMKTHFKVIFLFNLENRKGEGRAEFKNCW